ncbi:hypothetical protein GCM10008949_49290 [Deinococcus humi]|nr:hypothetical protein GCM10008949_49290 [Deinococcus humi]
MFSACWMAGPAVETMVWFMLASSTARRTVTSEMVFCRAVYSVGTVMQGLREGEGAVGAVLGQAKL